MGGGGGADCGVVDGHVGGLGPGRTPKCSEGSHGHVGGGDGADCGLVDGHVSGLGPGKTP